MPILKTIFRNRFQISEERLSICKTCEELEHGPNRCKKCGCFMDVKTLLPSAQCPLNKWEEYLEKEEQWTE